MSGNVVGKQVTLSGSDEVGSCTFSGRVKQGGNIKGNFVCVVDGTYQRGSVNLVKQ